MAESTEVVIIGGGPGGYLAALRGAQLGKKIVIVEKDRVGGTCMNYGCIPTKYLLHQTKILRELKGTKTFSGPLDQLTLNWDRVQSSRNAVVNRLVSGLEFLLKKGKVEVVNGEATVRKDGYVTARTTEGDRLFKAETVLLAPGSRAAGLPFLQPDGKRIVTSTEALEFADIPTTLLIVGAGAIGLELGSIYHRLGTDVTILEIMPNILPGTDLETAGRLERVLKKQRLKVLTQMRIEESRQTGEDIVLSGTCLRDRVPFEYRAEKVLVAAGRKPNTEGLWEDGADVELDERGFVKVNPRLETSRAGIYAVGDVIGGKLLAHKAYRDALVAVENAAGGSKTVDEATLPMAVFTDPEFASVGLTEEEAVRKGIKFHCGVFPLQASGRALTMDSTDGLVKIVADEKDRIIGAHLLAPGASDMIPELTLAISKKMTIEDVASLVYIHPTLSEAIGEAALKAKNEALHLLNS